MRLPTSYCCYLICRHSRPYLRGSRLFSFVSAGHGHSSFAKYGICRYASQAAAAEPQKFEFQAEINSLLEIVAKSLYSDQEVFIRELVSNASDALEKRRCSELKDGVIGEAAKAFELRIEVDEKEKKLIFVDTGIGMSRDELVNLLGTIAKSGSKAFRTDEKNAAESIIGQFGVGFYSAFVVSDKVCVTTRKLGDEMGHIWSWNGGAHFAIEPKPDAEVGTRVELHLRSGEAEKFAVPEKVIEVINKYSYFVTAPIFVNGERVNEMRALWTMPPVETTPEMHETFLSEHLAKTHHPHLADDRPQYTIQYQTDSPINIRALFYVPSRRVSNLEFAADSQRDIAISLYNQRVLIKPNAKELVPHYLRFLIGVVDSEDVPLNLSREMLQTDLVLEKIRRILAERCIRFFLSQLAKDRVKYSDFYRGYSMFFKEGIVTEQSNTIKEEISQLLLFESSSFRPGTLTTMSEYVDRIQSDQKHIYYIYAPSRQLAETSPYFELFKGKYEVLFLTDPADELVFLSMPQFRMKTLQSLEKWTKDEGLSINSDKDASEMMRDTSKKDFLGWLRESLGSVRVSDIKPSGRQSEHPFMITISADMGAARHMLRISEVKEMEHLVMLRPVLHVNLSHPVVAGIMRLKRNNPELASEIAEQVYDNALCTAGLLKDTSKMVGRLNKIFSDLLQLNAEKSQILTP